MSLLCLERHTLDYETDPTGGVSSKQALGCLADFANHVHLVGHKGWAPLRGISNKNFGLYSHVPQWHLWF